MEWGINFFPSYFYPLNAAVSDGCVDGPVCVTPERMKFLQQDFQLNSDQVPFWICWICVLCGLICTELFIFRDLALWMPCNKLNNLQRK